jgi:SAM-dependent methyltransferase
MSVKSPALATDQNLAGLAAGAAFDRLAAGYDEHFTESLIGRAQRNAVWKILLETFRPGQNILELNCGTGEDAFFLADHGISVLACDASQKMIARAEQRLHHKATATPVVFCHLPTERISELDPTPRFNGAFSNFSGLNCLEDLDTVACSLSNLVEQGDRLVLCFSTRFCLIEIIYYLARGKREKALRRCRGQAKALIDGMPLTVYYPSLRDICKSFAPHFRLRFSRGIGVAIPPSYMEHWVRQHPAVFRLLCRIESAVATLPLFRTTGDHMLLCFEKVSP